VRVVVALHGASARRLSVLLLLRGAFAFTDELEAWGTLERDESTRSNALAGGAPAVDRPGPLGRVGRSADIAALAAAQRRLWAVRAALPSPHLADGSAVALEESLRLAARAASWRRNGRGDWDVRRVDPWTPRTPWSDARPACTQPIDLARGGWEA